MNAASGYAKTKRVGGGVMDSSEAGLREDQGSMGSGLRRLSATFWLPSVGTVLLVLSFVFLLAQSVGGETWDEHIHEVGYYEPTKFAEGAFANLKPNFDLITIDLEFYGMLPMAFASTVTDWLSELFRISEGERADLYRFMLHAGAMAFGVGTVWLTFLTLKLLTRSRLIAVAGASALGLYPLWLGYSFFNFKDIPSAFFYALAVYGSLLAISPAKKDFRLGLTLAVIAFIGSAGVKLAAAAMLVVPALALLYAAFAYNRHRRTRPLWIIGAMPVALLGAWLITPAAWVEPMRFVTASIEYMSHHAWAGCTLTAGKCVGATLPGWSAASYLGAWAGAQLPLFILVLGFPAFAFVAVAGRARERFLAAASILPVALVITLNSTLYDGLRHMTFVMPGIFATIFVALAALRRFSGRAERPLKLVSLGAGGLAALNMLMFAVDNVSLFPFNYVYFNEAARGHANEKTFETDYWGYSLHQATMEMDRYAADNPDHPRIFTANPVHLAIPYLRSDMIVVGSEQLEKEAPIIDVSYTRSNLQPPNGCKPVAWVQRQLLLAPEPMKLSFVAVCKKTP